MHLQKHGSEKDQILRGDNEKDMEARGSKALLTIRMYWKIQS